MPIDVAKYRSIGGSIKKRGSHKFDEAPNESVLRERVREKNEQILNLMRNEPNAAKRMKLARKSRGILERTVWDGSVGAKSQKKFARLQQSGREEIQKAMDPNSNKNFKVRQRKPGEEPKQRSAKPAEEAKRD